ncbi:MAG: DUF4174 domain-containing protein [Bacteroidota bacterium]|nr:DUF4174 domain-containing protein [Bacteroidota bacterium]
MKKYQWKNRVLLVFTPDYEDARFKNQQEIITDNTNAIEERDLIVKIISLKSDLEEKQFSKAEVLQLRENFSIGNSDYTVILIGKDGTVKLRINDVVQANQLFSLIDSMPMRKEEMKNR